MNTEFAKEMMELHQKVAKESIVGWLVNFSASVPLGC